MHRAAADVARFLNSFRKLWLPLVLIALLSLASVELMRRLPCAQIKYQVDLNSWRSVKTTRVWNLPPRTIISETEASRFYREHFGTPPENQELALDSDLSVSITGEIIAQVNGYAGAPDVQELKAAIGETPDLPRGIDWPEGHSVAVKQRILTDYFEIVRQSGGYDRGYLTFANHFLWSAFKLRGDMTPEDLPSVEAVIAGNVWVEFKQKMPGYDALPSREMQDWERQRFK